MKIWWLPNFGMVSQDIPKPLAFGKTPHVFFDQEPVRKVTQVAARPRGFRGPSRGIHVGRCGWQEGGGKACTEDGWGTRIKKVFDIGD